MKTIDLNHLIQTFLLFFFLSGSAVAQPLSGTDLMTTPNDWDCADNNTRQITAFLNAKIAESEQQREKHWNRKFTDQTSYEQSIEKNRERLRFITGVRDRRKPFDAPEYIATLDAPALIAETNTHFFYAIRWAVFETLNGEGILVEPKSGIVKNALIHIPHAGITPEQIVGIDDNWHSNHFDALPEN